MKLIMKLLSSAAVGSIVSFSAAAAEQPSSGKIGLEAVSPDQVPEAVAEPDTDDPNRGLAVIVVTAQRREQNVQDVPIAISAFSADELQSRNVSQTLDVAQYVPNLFGSSNAGIGSANTYYLRGLGNSESIATFDPPVGTYIDDIYLSRQNANNFGFFDVERVEVLRGPQGVTFGRNTTGGAINVIMKEPSDELGGFFEAGLGRFDRRLLRGSIDLPVSPQLSFKISGYDQNDDGYVENTRTGETLNDSDASGIRGAVRFSLGANVELNASATFVQSDGEHLLNDLCDPLEPAQCGGRYAVTGLRESFPEGQSQFAPLPISGRKAFFNLGNETDTIILSSKLDIELGDQLLSLITGYVDLEQKYALDIFDGRNAPSISQANPALRPLPGYGFTIINDGRHKQFTQEVKLNGSIMGGFIEYVAGVYYYKETNDTDFADVLTLASGNPLLLSDRFLQNEVEAWAIYAQSDFHVTDEITITVGGRYTDETKTVSISDSRDSCSPDIATCLFDNNLQTSGGVQIPTELTSRLFTPRVAVTYEPTDDLLLFASANKGFKSGGWGSRATSPSIFLPFDPEQVWSYEAGLKTELFDNRLRASLTAFWMDVTDLQTPSALLNPNGSINYITRNFANYQNRGVELELTATPARGLTTYLSVGYQNDKYQLPSGTDVDEYGIQPVIVQQQLCLDQLAAGQIPLGPNTAPAGAQPNNAPACAAGIVTSSGGIATPVRTPDWTISGGFSYEIPLSGSGLSIVPGVNIIYRSGMEVQTANISIFTGGATGVNGMFPSNPFSGDFITGSKSPAHFLVNPFVGLNVADEWRLSVECNNCFGKVVNETSISQTSYYNPPATWMLKAKKTF